MTFPKTSENDSPSNLSVSVQFFCVDRTFCTKLDLACTKPSLKDRSELPKVPQNSAEPLGFCRKVLQNVSHSKRPVGERFCRTSKVLQNFGSQAQLFIGTGKSGHYEKGFFTGRISSISKFSRISRRWSDSPLLSTVWGLSRVSKFSRISRKRTFLKRPLFQNRDRKNHDSQRRDRILRFFLRPEIGQFSPHFGAISSLNHTNNLEKKEKNPLEKFKKSSGDGAPKLQISVPCPGNVLSATTTTESLIW